MKIYSIVNINGIQYRLDGRICVMAQMPIYECTDVHSGMRGYVAYSTRINQFGPIMHRANDALLAGCDMVRGIKTR